MARKAGEPHWWSWKLLGVLLYAELACIVRLAPGSLVVTLGPLAAHLGTRTDRLRAPLKRLAALGIIDLTLSRYSATLNIKSPIGYAPAGVIDVEPERGRAQVIYSIPVSDSTSSGGSYAVFTNPSTKRSES